MNQSILNLYQEKLERLQTALVLETRPDERMRLEHLIQQTERELAEYQAKTPRTPAPAQMADKSVSVRSTGDQTPFDVFLAHNSQDKAQVEQIAAKLKQRRLCYWIDKEQIAPGAWFQDIIQKAIPQVKSVAMFIGPEGLGKWQAVELRTFISRCVNFGLPVIPVLLPDVREIPDPFLFLKELNWVQFQQIDDEEALDNLEWGITGRHPKRGR